MDPNDKDLTGQMATAAYTISTIVAVVLVWVWLVFLIIGIVSAKSVTYADVIKGGALTFALAAAIYFAGWGWRRYWTGRSDHFFTRK